MCSSSESSFEFWTLQNQSSYVRQLQPSIELLSVQSAVLMNVKLHPSKRGINNYTVITRKRRGNTCPTGGCWFGGITAFRASWFRFNSVIVWKVRECYHLNLAKRNLWCLSCAWHYIAHSHIRGPSKLWHYCPWCRRCSQFADHRDRIEHSAHLQIEPISQIYQGGFSYMCYVLCIPGLHSPISVLDSWTALPCLLVRRRQSACASENCTIHVWSPRWLAVAELPVARFDMIESGVARPNARHTPGAPRHSFPSSARRIDK